MSRSVRTLLLTGLIAACCWPWFGQLGLPPMAPDSVTWIVESRSTHAGWTEWVFATRQFNVGWRPLTGLTFTLDHLLFGLRPPGYRATDLALHAASIAMVFVGFRALRGQRPPWAALVAAAVFALHPVADEVVPYLARRSYALSTVLGLGGLVAFRRGRSWPAGLLLAAGFLANETGVLYAAALPFVVPEQRERPGWRAWLLPAGIAGAAVLVRLAVVGGLGGYRLPEGEEGRALGVFAAFWRELGTVPVGSPAALSLALLVLAVPYYLWAASRPPRMRALFAGWLGAYALLFASQGVWFPRQAYVALVPLSFLVADVLASTLAERRGAALAAHLVPQLLLIAALLARSPVMRGPDQVRQAERRARAQMIDRMHAELARLEEPATVWLVLPYERRPSRPGALRAAAAGRGLPRVARQPALWVATLLEQRDVSLEELVYFEAGTLPAVGDGLVTLPEGTSYFVREGERLRARDATAPRTVPVPPVEDGRAAWVLAADPERCVLARR